MVQGKARLHFRAATVDAIRQLKFATFLTPPIYSGPNSIGLPHVFPLKQEPFVYQDFPVMMKFRARCKTGFVCNRKFLRR